jgi:hypothetical protein
MKLYRRLLVFISVVIVVGCNDQGSEPIPQYTVTIEDHTTTPFQFPSGVYYSFVFPEPQSFEFDVDAVFRQAAARGVRLRDAWYKNYSGGCHPPGSNIVFEIIVPAGFVVRVDERSPIMERIGFVETTNPHVESCAYTVRHYHFQE